MLGVLKTGSAYIALDPAYPTERLRYILRDSQATVIVANSQTAEFAQSLAGEAVDVLDVDRVGEGDRTPQPLPPVAPDALAYLLYTSGSTGQPKGVMQNHRNVLHFIRVYTNNLHITPADRLTLLSSYSFDAAVMDIFGALLNGATLYPIDVKQEGLSHLHRYLVKEKITVYHSTPTLYRYLIETEENAGSPQTESATFPEARLVVLGGEAVSKRDVDAYRRHFPVEAVFVNGLGPSESTVTLQQFITHDTPVHLSNVPVGLPVEDTEILLLNEAGEETQLYGEIAIRSAHVALGYWQQPELTAAAFLADKQNSLRRAYETTDKTI